MSEVRHKLKLVTLADRLSLCQLDSDSEIPAWARGGSFVSVRRTGDELSIICPAISVPDGIRCSTGWRALRVAGQLDFSEYGVLASITGPLASAGISMLTVCTYGTDCVLVRETDLQRASKVLERAGHNVEEGEQPGSAV